MASSDYDTYGQLKIKQVLLDAPSGLVFHDPNDDTKKATLKVTGLGAGNVDIDLPTQAGALLGANSNLNGANLTAGSVATAALADDAVTAAKLDLAGAGDIGAGGALADSFFISDADDSNNVKRITGTELKNLVGGDSFPSASDAQMLVSSGNDNYASVSMSGDATVAANGALTIANDAVNNAKVAAAAAIAGSKIAPDFGAQKVETTGDIEAGAAAAFYLGDSGTDGTWRMRVNGADWVVEKREGGSYVQKGSFTA